MLGLASHLFIDSDNRLTGTSSNFTHSIKLPGNVQYDHVALLQGSFPKSYYLVQSGNNTFTLTEGKSSATVTIPAGNYSMNSFRTVLQANMTSASPTSYVYAVSQPATATAASTGKYTYTVTGNGAVQPVISFPTSSTLYLQMGFDSTSSNAFVASTLTSTNVVNFNSTIGMIVKSDIVDAANSDGGHGSGVLQEVFSFNTSDFSNIGFSNMNVLFSAKRLKGGTLPMSAQFTITDTDDRIINFNGGSVNFSLVFFRKDDYHDLALRDLKMRWYQEILAGKMAPNGTPNSDLSAQ